MWANNIILIKNGLIILTKGWEDIEVGDIEIKEVKRYKCPLVTVPYEDYEYAKPLFEAEPGKYIIYT